MRHSQSILVLLAAAIGLSAALPACGGDPKPSKYSAQQVYVEDTTLGPGDVFVVRVFRQKDLTGEYAVSSEGTISFPLIGEVKVGGKTAVQVGRDIRDLLAKGYLRNPQVSVLVKAYKSKKVSVFGQVRKPSTFAFVEGMTIVEAVSAAGGFSPMAKKNAVKVTRSIKGKKTKFTVPVASIGRGTANTFYMRPGDVVFVPKRLW